MRRMTRAKQRQAIAGVQFRTFDSNGTPRAKTLKTFFIAGKKSLTLLCDFC
jgi:hypothetical protein